nr:PilZ domain-containing protein [Texcoconibacillus texcoconensis]
MKKNLVKQKGENERLLENVYHLKQKQQEIERRKAFRLEVSNVDCEITLNGIGDRKLNHLIGKKGTGTIHDLSANGARLACHYDLPVRKGIIIGIDFIFREEHFSFRAKLVRKIEHFEGNHVEFGIEFIGMSIQEQEQLSSLLIATEREYMRSKGYKNVHFFENYKN